MVLFPHSAVSTLIFPAALKTFTTLCCSPHLSLKPPPHCETWQARTSTTSLLFSSPLSARWKPFFADKPLWIISAHRARACVAAFSRSVCCIFWFIYTLMIVAPHACQEIHSELCMCLMRAPNLIWNMHRCMNLFIVEKSPVHPGESHFPRWSYSGMGWRDFWKCPTCHLQIERLVHLSLRGMMEAGEMIWLLVEDWASRFKAACLVKL